MSDSSKNLPGRAGSVRRRNVLKSTAGMVATGVFPAVHPEEKIVTPHLGTAINEDPVIAGRLKADTKTETRSVSAERDKKEMGMGPAIEQVTIAAPGGTCPASVLSPDGKGPWPAVVFYGDAGGIRPAMLQMAQRLAGAGYLVLLPDLYYRYGPYGPLVPEQVFKGDVAAILGPLMATTGTEQASKDTAAFLAYLDTRPDVARDRIGAVGFCMGGGLAIAAAASYPQRFAAVASFHGGNLATDAPASPHRFVRTLAAEAYIAAADKDDSYPPPMAARLEAALKNAGVSYRAETYAGAAHGWMVPDFPTYDRASAERGWQALLQLLDRKLRS
jgi:carboxymethylenebutenolidase